MLKTKRIISFLSAIAVFFSVFSFNRGFPVLAAEKKLAIVDATDVVVRKEPNASSAKADSVNISYREVTVIGTSGDWLKVEYYRAGTKYTGYIKNVSDWVTITNYNADLSFDEQLKLFPESYRDKLKELHSKYPKWKFVPDKVSSSFVSLVNLESVNMRKQVSGSGQPISWRSMGPAAYDWDTGKWVFYNGDWTGASREIIAYYMDPRNFLNETEIYQFLQQSYGDGDYTEEGLKKIVAGTFLEKGYSDPKDTTYGGSYLKLILDAGKKSGVSPYIIASKIRQEQGTCLNKDGAFTPTNLISGKYSGYTGYYNFFNFSATGSDSTQVAKNGLEYAKKQSWNSIPAAIIGGAKKLAESYIELGQDTYYYQDYNVRMPQKGLPYHQYAQAVHDARSKGYSLNSFYMGDASSQLTFRIPVFSSIPSSCAKPAENKTLNNYYFKNLSVSGLTPSFSMFTYNYDLKITGDAAISYKLPDNATVVSANEFNVKAGKTDIKLTVKSQSGYTTDYVISVNASKACKIYVNNASGGEAADLVRTGDVNLDGRITISDIGNIRLHLLKRYTLTGKNAIAADVNKDGKISISDIGNIRLHLLGRYTIKD